LARLGGARHGKAWEKNRSREISAIMEKLEEKNVGEDGRFLTKKEHV